LGFGLNILALLYTVFALKEDRCDLEVASTGMDLTNRNFGKIFRTTFSDKSVAKNYR
jgi:hypothetical protein